MAGVAGHQRRFALYFGLSRKIRMEFSGNGTGCCIPSLPVICYSGWITANQGSIEYYLISKVDQIPFPSKLQ